MGQAKSKINIGGGSAMSEYYNQAKERLERENTGRGFDKAAEVMRNDVCRVLIDFCRQDEEFAQAVAQGGSFSDCMKAVAQNVGSGISDLTAYKRAVQFYFPGADIRMHMEIDLCGVNEDQAPGKAGVLLDLSDFF